MLRFLGVRTRTEACWPIKGASSPETETAADTIIGAGVGRGELCEGSKEAFGEPRVLIGLLSIEATGLQTS